MAMIPLMVPVSYLTLCQHLRLERDWTFLPKEYSSESDKHANEDLEWVSSDSIKTLIRLLLATIGPERPRVFSKQDPYCIDFVDAELSRHNGR